MGTNAAALLPRTGGDEDRRNGRYSTRFAYPSAQSRAARSFIARQFCRKRCEAAGSRFMAGEAIAGVSGNSESITSRPAAISRLSSAEEELGTYPANHAILLVFHENPLSGNACFIALAPSSSTSCSALRLRHPREPPAVRREAQSVHLPRRHAPPLKSVPERNHRVEYKAATTEYLSLPNLHHPSHQPRLDRGPSGDPAEGPSDGAIQHQG